MYWRKISEEKCRTQRFLADLCFDSVIIHIDPGTEDLYMMSCLTSTIASACSQADQSAGGQGLDELIRCFEVLSDFSRTYELVSSTILRFTRRSIYMGDRHVRHYIWIRVQINFMVH